MLNIGPLELMVVLLIALVVVGPKRLPEIGRQVGRVLHDFRKVQTEVKDAIRFDVDADDEPPTKQASWSAAGIADADDHVDERARSEDGTERAERRAAERARRARAKGPGTGEPDDKDSAEEAEAPSLPASETAPTTPDPPAAAPAESPSANGSSRGDGSSPAAGEPA